jgi:hypothetical protein
MGQVYGHEAETQERGLRPEERLEFHQERSGPVMERLRHWLEAQFAERNGAQLGAGQGDHVLTATLAAFDAVSPASRSPV